MNLTIKPHGPTIVLLAASLYTTDEHSFKDVSNSYLLAESLSHSLDDLLSGLFEKTPVKPYSVDVLLYQDFKPYDWMHATRPVVFDLIESLKLPARSVEILRSDFTDVRAHQVHFSPDIIQRLHETEKVIVHGKRDIVQTLWSIVEHSTSSAT